MIDTSTTFGLLADDTRRRLLVQLVNNESVDIADESLLEGAPQNASSPTNQQEFAKTGSSHTRTVSLHHNHLPKLRSHGMIEWNRETQTLSRGEAFEEIEPLLRLLDTNSRALPTGLF